MAVHVPRRVVLSSIAGIAGLGRVPARAQEDAAAKLIAGVAKEVIDLIKNTSPGAEREAGIRKVLEQSFDLSFMGRSALGTYWNETSEEQR